MVGWALRGCLLLTPLVGALSPMAARAGAAEDAAVLRAGALATEAKLLFQQKVYDQAAERFMEAYTLVRRPALLFNAARAYEEGGLLAKAVALFKAYVNLADAPADGKADATSRVQRMQAVLEERRAAEDAKAASAREADRAEAARDAKSAQEAAAARDAAATKQASPGEPSKPAGAASGEAAAAQRRTADREAAAAKRALDAQQGVAKSALAPKPAFPWVPVAATAGTGIAAAVLYGLALGQESAAQQLEPKLKSEADKAQYLEYAGNYNTFRVSSLGFVVVAAGCSAWAGYELYARQRPANPTPQRAVAWQLHLAPTGLALSF